MKYDFLLCTEIYTLQIKVILCTNTKTENNTKYDYCAFMFQTKNFILLSYEKSDMTN